MDLLDHQSTFHPVEIMVAEQQEAKGRPVGVMEENLETSFDIDMYLLIRVAIRFGTEANFLGV